MRLLFKYYGLFLTRYIRLFDLTYRKYEEISPPHVEEFCYITDNTYTKEEVIFNIDASFF